MSGQKPSVPKGTRDFSPQVMVRRDYIFRIIRDTFHVFGYQAIETPAMEYLDTLLGKYGDEGDKLLFKILNSGNFLGKVDGSDLQARDPASLSSLICERGLRYDLTVPFARYVVQHLNDITFPFKRYQIQPVWRADKPQKGRYREFYQCDADVIGSNSLLNERELIEIIIQIFSKLGINCQIKVNNRKILSGLSVLMGAPERLTDITSSLDKLEKIGRENVNAELRLKGFSEQAVSQLQPLFDLEGRNPDKLDKLQGMMPDIPVGMDGIEEMDQLLDLCSGLAREGQIVFDVNLARGLNYYTGTIIEVLATDIGIGSLCGGGRYDDLTGIFGLEGVSGVGVSFGADRIFDVMNSLELFPETATASTRLMFANFGEKEERYILEMIPGFRNAGIVTELYPDPVKLKKQMSYANSNEIPFVALIGEDEMKKGSITLKDMNTGEQNEVDTQDLMTRLTTSSM